MRSMVLVSVVVLLASAPSLSWADDPGDPLAMPSDPEAVRHLERGDTHFRLREFKEAVEEYREGTRIEPSPRFLYNIAQSFRQLKDYENSLWYFRQWLSVAKPPDEMRGPIEEVMTKMREEMEAVATTKPPTEPAGNGGASTDTESAPTEVAVRSSFTTRRKVALGVGVGGLVALGGGVLFGLRASGFDDDAAALCPDVSCDQSAEANALIDRAQTNSLYSRVSYGVGAVAILGAAVLWFTGAPESGDPMSSQQAAVTPRVSGAFAGIDVTVRFP